MVHHGATQWEANQNDSSWGRSAGRSGQAVGLRSALPVRSTHHAEPWFTSPASCSSELCCRWPGAFGSSSPCRRRNGGSRTTSSTRKRAGQGADLFAADSSSCGLNLAGRRRSKPRCHFSFPGGPAHHPQHRAETPIGFSRTVSASYGMRGSKMCRGSNSCGNIPHPQGEEGSFPRTANRFTKGLRGLKE